MVSNIVLKIFLVFLYFIFLFNASITIAKTTIKGEIIAGFALRPVIPEEY